MLLIGMLDGCWGREKEKKKKHFKDVLESEEVRSKNPVRMRGIGFVCPRGPSFYGGGGGGGAVHNSSIFPFHLILDLPREMNFFGIDADNGSGGGSREVYTVLYRHACIQYVTVV